MSQVKPVTCHWFAERVYRLYNLIAIFLLMILYFQVPNFYFVKEIFYLGIAPVVLFVILFSASRTLDFQYALITLLMIFFLGVAFILKDDIRDFLQQAANLVLFSLVIFIGGRTGYKALLDSIVLSAFVVSLVTAYIHLDPLQFSQTISQLGYNEGYLGEGGLTFFSSTIPWINPNTFGYMFITPLLLSLVRVSENSRWLYGICCAVFIAVLIFSFSKGVFLSLLICLGLLAVLGGASLYGIVLSIIGLILLLMLDLSSPLLYKFEAFFGLGDGRSVGDSSERMVLMAKSIDLLSPSSILGLDDGSELLRASTEIGWSDHNFFLYALTKYGFMFTSLLVFLHALIILNLFKVSQRVPLSDARVATALLCGNFALFISLVFGPPFPHNWIVLGISVCFLREEGLGSTRGSKSLSTV